MSVATDLEYGGGNTFGQRYSQYANLIVKKIIC